MICTEISRGLRDLQNGEAIDYVDFEWYEARKKINLKTSRNGREIGIRLSDTALRRGIRQDDILASDGDTVYAANILPCRALKIAAVDARVLAKICYEVGNRHAPLFYGEAPYTFYTPYDLPMRELLEHLGADAGEVTVAFDPDKSISSSAQAHAH